MTIEPNCIANMLKVCCRPFKIRLPSLVINPISYLVEWAYKVLYLYGMGQPQMLTPARIKYLTLSRTFSCNKAVEEIGYKPLVTLMVSSTSFGLSS
jgi:sterol-4alpha-carboxylate 3-dehydrogenase (decarboxylating)